MEREAQFENLYRRYYSLVVGYLMQSARLSRDDARDLAQDIFLRVYESLDKYRGAAEWSFIRTVAHRAALNHIRAQHTAKRSPESSLLDADVFRPSYDAATPQDQQIAARETQARLHAAIDALPSSTRSIVLLQLQELSYDEIAQALAISITAVKSGLRDAKARLREQLGTDAFATRFDEPVHNLPARSFPEQQYRRTVPRLSEEDIASELLTKVVALETRHRHLVRQIDQYERTLKLHEQRVDKATAIAVAAVRSPDP